jgi:serine/threonine protein phosphatase 1
VTTTESANDGEVLQMSKHVNPMTRRPILVIADLHGHLDLFERALEHGRHLAGRADVTVVTLGDYCDNGPAVPELLDRLAGFADEHAGEFLPILGNHDLACLRALGDENGAGDPRWWERWRQRYPNGKAAWTPTQYGATTLEAFRASFPRAHWRFLAGLPWVVKLAGYVFVHAGLEPGAPIDEQLPPLGRRDPSGLAEWSHMPRPVREDALSRTFDPSWTSVVVSGHVKHRDGQDLVAPNRLSFHSGTCRGEALHAALLPPEAPVGRLPAATLFAVTATVVTYMEVSP